MTTDRNRAPWRRTRIGMLQSLVLLVRGRLSLAGRLGHAFAAWSTAPARPS